MDTETYTLPRPDGTDLLMENSNKLLHELPWITGVKTGSTPLSGGCLVSSGSRGGVSLIAVVLGESDYDKRWEDCQELLEYGFSLYRRVRVVSRGDSLFEVAVPFRPGDPLEVVAARTLVVPVFREDEVGTSVRAQKVRWPVEAGETSRLPGGHGGGRDRRLRRSRSGRGGRRALAGCDFGRSEPFAPAGDTPGPGPPHHHGVIARNGSEA